MSGIAALILAAGTSSRFRAAEPGPVTKLVADLDGAPLVRHVALAALASRARPVVVVTGYARVEVEAALEGLDVGVVHNSRFADGLAASLALGLAAMPGDVSGTVVLLGDMPLVSARLIDRLIEAFAGSPQADAAVPVLHGRRGNPALLGRRLFEPAMALVGDEGARRLLSRAHVIEVAVEDPGSVIDIDDPGTLRRVGTSLDGSRASSTPGCD